MKIYVKAFIDKNLGDDLMIVQLLENSPDIDFYIYCESHQVPFYTELLKSYSNYVFTQVELWKIHNFGVGFFDSILLIGGSVLQGNRNRGCFYRFRNTMTILSAKLFGTKYIILGCNVGPFINKFTELFVKLELFSANLITTRDQASYDFIEKIVGRREVYLFSDILMDFKNDYNVSFNPDGSRLGISVLNSTNENICNQKIRNFFAELIDLYIQKTNASVTLFAFDSGKQNDHEEASKTLELVKNKERVEIITHNEDYLALPHALSKCSILIGVRFHAIVLGLSMGVPLIPAIYSNKTENFLNDIGYNKKKIDIRNIEAYNVETLVEYIMKNDESKVFELNKNSAVGHMSTFRDYLNL